MLVRLLIDDKFDESLKCSLASVKNDSDTS